MKKQTNYDLWLRTGAPSLLLGLAALLFWGLAYPHHLHHQEQLQLFLFTTDYLNEKLGHPGGLAEYIAEFLTQFDYYAWAGAAIIAGLSIILQRLIASLIRSDRWSAWLGLLPALAVWAFLCDENGLLSFPIALTLTLSVWRGYQLLPDRLPLRLPIGLIVLPLLYWAVGGVALLFALALTIESHRKPWSFALLLYTLLLPIAASYQLHYPLSRLFCGIDYYRFPEIYPAAQWVAMGLAVAIPLLSNYFFIDRVNAHLSDPYTSIYRTDKRSFIDRVNAHLSMRYMLPLGCLLGAGWIYTASDFEKERLMHYDYLTRMRQWKAIIRMAEQKTPDAPFSVACLNLALAKTGQLGDRLFQFYQNGTEGLIPTFERDFISPLPASEVFYHLGMINSSLRYTFEAMEAIPDYRKSSRAFVRLAETNLINGQYAVAAKYLRALQQTLFYRKWATQAMGFLGNDRRIEQHAEWGWLRKARYTEDFLFSDAEMDNMLGLLIQQNPTNRLAFEYLMAYELLRKDLEKFARYYPLGRQMGYNHIPRSYQEALIYLWTQEHSNFQGLPWSISQEVLQGVTEFARLYMQGQKNEPLLREKYGKTFWNYLLFRN